MMTAAATHMAATKQHAVLIEPLRLRKDSGNTATYADIMLAQPTIIATLPYRGRMKNKERKHIIEKKIRVSDNLLRGDGSAHDTLLSWPIDAR
jgi:hypothetical protein